MTTATNDPNRLMTTDEAMDFFQRDNKCSFLRFVRTEGVPHIRVTRRCIRFDRQALERWIESRTIGRRGAK